MVQFKFITSKENEFVIQLPNRIQKTKTQRRTNALERPPL